MEGAAVIPPVFRRLRVLLATMLLVATILPFGVAPAAAAGSVSILTFGDTYTEDFDTLAATGTSGIVPTGWEFAEAGTNANTSYTAGTGSSNTGDTYSFGASGSPERALGGLQSGSLNPTIGVLLVNATGGTLTSLAVAYTGEMWRAGVTNRGVADRLDVQYSTDAASLLTGTWMDADGLDFASPNLAAAAGALDGNAAGNRTAVSATISGLSVPNGGLIWIRWADFNITSSDDGLAIDDVAITAAGDIPEEDAAPSVASTVPANGATDFPYASNLTVTFSEPVNLGDPAFTLACTNGVIGLAVSGGPTSFTLDPEADLLDG
jgi:hypothetical protein